LFCRIAVSVGTVLVLLAGVLGVFASTMSSVSEEDATVSVSTSEPESVSLVTRWWSPDLIPDRSWADYGLEAFSNLTCHSWQLWWDEALEESSYEYSEWCDIPSDAFASLLDTMDSEGFGEMEGLYCDAGGVYEADPPVTSLTVSTAGVNKTVKFEENAMLGLMPQTACSMGAMVYDSVSVDVTIELMSEFNYEVSVVVSNDGDSEVSLSGATSDFWLFVVVRENGCTFRHEGDTMCPCIIPIAPHAEFVLEAQEVDASGFCDGSYIIFVNQVGGGFAEFSVDGNDAYVNSPPRDHGCCVNEADSGSMTIELLGCCDAEDHRDDIMIQWDWESDGEWDTDWTSDKSVAHDFDGGDINVTYQLKDSDGATSIGYVLFSSESSSKTETSALLAAALIAIVAAVVVVLLLMRSRRKSGPGQ